MLLTEIINSRDKIISSPILGNRLDDLKKCAGEYLDKKIEYAALSQYLRFYRDGDRAEFQQIYYAHRKRLSALAAMLFIYRDMRFKEPLEDAIWAICDEFTWVLPAHLPQDSDRYECYIDLFAAETGADLAEIKYLLSDILSDRVKARMTKALRTRVIDAYFNSPEPYHWEGGNNNWVAVCGGSVGEVILLEGTDEEIKKMIPRMRTTLEGFLNGFSKDGICMEGFSYWNYGFGNFVIFAEALRQYTNGEIDYFKDERVKRISHFQDAAIIRPGASIAFSDGSSVAKPSHYLTYFLHSKYPDLCIYPKNTYSRFATHYRFGLFIRCFAWPSCYPADVCVKKTAAVDIFHDAGWYIKKSDKLILLAKGGNNDEPHNHNDVGSFYIDNYQNSVVADFGCAEYTRQYFQDEFRYTYLVNSSLGHNLPMIDGAGQSAGKQFCAEILKADAECFKMEIAPAYDIEKLKSLVRTLSLDGDTVTLTDEYELSESAEICERFVTYIKPEVSGNKVVLGNAVLTADSDNIKVTESSYNSHETCQPVKVYLIDVVYPNACGSLKASITIKAAN